MNETAIKWYKKLGFPTAYDEAFYAAAAAADLFAVDPTNPVSYLIAKQDLAFNLVYFLSRCEQMHQAFCSRNIPESIFFACARGLTEEAQLCLEAFGHIGVYEVAWFHKVINLRSILTIGRLNFDISTADQACVGGPIREGDHILAVHIPRGGKLSAEACCRSMDEAERFFARYYPEHDFQYFVCRSWLLSEALDAFLGESSNIRQFRQLFTLYRTTENDSAIKFVFGRTVTRENIRQFQPKTGLQAKLQKHISEGGRLYSACGVSARRLQGTSNTDCWNGKSQNSVSLPAES